MYILFTNISDLRICINGQLIMMNASAFTIESLPWYRDKEYPFRSRAFMDSPALELFQLYLTLGELDYSISYLNPFRIEDAGYYGTDAILEFSDGTKLKFNLCDQRQPLCEERFEDIQALFAVMTERVSRTAVRPYLFDAQQVLNSNLELALQSRRRS